MTLWASAIKVVLWQQDTLHFHVILFRCFLLHLLDAPSDLSRGPERIWTRFGQRLVNLGLGLDERADDPVSPSQRPPVQCPPRRRYAPDAAWPGPSFVPMDQSVPVPPFIPPPLHHHANINPDMNFTRDLGLGFGLEFNDQPVPARSAATTINLNIPGADKDGLVGGAGVACYLLLWVLVLAMAILHRWSMAETQSDSRAVCRIPRRTVESTTDVGERAIAGVDIPPATKAATPSLITSGHDQLDRRVFMPGGWLHERREQSTFDMYEEPVPDMLSWTLFYLRAQMGIEAWTHITVLASILGISNRGSNGVMTLERRPRNGCLSGTNEFDAGVSAPAEQSGMEQSSAAPNKMPSGLGLAESGYSGMEMCNRRRCGLLAITDDVAVKDPDPVQTMRLDVVCSDPIRSTLSLVMSNQANHGSYSGDVSSDGSESDGESFGIGTQRASKGSDADGQRQDAALSDTGCAHRLRRARSVGYLSTKRDVFDDDNEVTGDDPYWTEQVNARLSDERDLDLLPAPSRYDACSWLREGREDETDNWRVRSTQVTQVDKPRRYSSPPLSSNASLSHRETRYVAPTLAGGATSKDGIYVVPQKRGGRYRSPVSSPQLCDRPASLGFFPFRRTPALLTSEAWRPGCLYIADPPANEASEAEAWWDHLTRGGATATGHGVETCGKVREEGSRDVQESGVSWRDRYENDPGSRRIISSHRRAMTEG